jgi:WD40 repeat protein
VKQSASQSEKTSAGPRAFWCFISYRHADNQTPGRQWATWLHQAIETYEVPGDLIGTVNERGDVIPERIFPVFRDEEELPVDADLASPIYRALDQSKFLLVICSPRAVESTYVAKEIIYFKKLGRSDRVLAVMVAGEPNARWDAGKQASGFSPVDECFPEPLRHAVDAEGNLLSDHTEPVAADFRLPDGNGEGWTTPEAYRQALIRESSANGRVIDEKVKRYRERAELMKLKVLAGILGVPLGTLTQRDKAYQLARARRRQRITFWVASALAALALVAVGAGWYAWGKKNAAQVAEQKERDARENETTARKRAVDALANSDFREATNRLRQPERTGEALALLARAARLANHKAAETRLWAIFQQRDFWVQVPTSVPASPAKSSTSPDAVDPLFSTVPYGKQRLKPAWFSRSGDGQSCVTIVNGDIVDGPIEIFHFRVWRRDGTPVTPWLTVSNPEEKDIRALSEAHLSRDGRYVAVAAFVWREPEFIEVWDTKTKKPIGAKIVATGNSPHHQNVSFTRVQFLPQSRQEDQARPLLLIASAKGDASVFAVSEDGLEPVGKNSHASGVVAASVDEKAEWLMSASDDRQVRVWDLANNKLLGPPIELPGAILSLERSQTDRLHITMVENAVAEYRLWHPFTAPIPAGTQSLPDGEFTIVEKDKKEEGPNAIHYASPGAVLAKSTDGKKIAQLIKENEVGVYDAPGGPGAKARWTHTFPSKVLDARFVGKQDWLLVQLDTFVTEIWNIGRGERVGAPIEEARLFTDGETPARPLASTLAASEDKVVTRSFFWNPPNAASRWFTVWDLGSGIPLIDRVSAIDDSLEDDPITRAGHDEEGLRVLLGADKPGPAKACLELTPPTELRPRLPEFAEAFGGLTAQIDGGFSTVPDRMQKTESFIAELKSYQAKMRASSAPP